MIEDASNLVIKISVSIVLTSVALENIRSFVAALEIFAGSDGPFLFEISDLLLSLGSFGDHRRLARCLRCSKRHHFYVYSV